MSYRQIYFQIVFGTQNREPTLSESYCKELYNYIWGVVKNNKCKLYQINGVADHIHIISYLHPSISLEDFIKSIKVSSSLWLKDNSHFPGFDGWSKGYGAFTYSFREKGAIIEYVRNQKEHHKHETFKEEFKRLLEENGVEFDEKYLL